MPRHVVSTVLAVLLARLLAIRLGLTMPQVAMACVFILMQPRIELVLIKSLYRLAGTVVGALAITVLAARYAATPSSFLLAIGCWVCGCTALATFSTQFRAYGIVLAGYTAVIVGIPIAFEPGQAGAEALMRLKEVGLGIACAAFLAVLSGLVWRDPGPGASETASAAHGRRAASPAIPGALIAALLPASAMLIVGSLWMSTRWPGGAIATLNTTVNCALAALAPAPLAAATQMSRGTLLAVAAVLVLLAAHAFLGEYPGLYLVFVPALALGAVFTAHPDTMGLGLGYGITLCMLGLPEGLGRDGLSLHLDAAAGMLLSVVALMTICAAARWLPALACRQPCRE